MKTNKNKNSVSQALMDLEEMKKLLKENTRGAIQAMLAESVKDALNSSIEDEDEDEYTISDENESEPEVMDNDEKESEECEGGDCPVHGDEDNEESEDEAAEGNEEAEDSDDAEWSEFDKFKDKEGAYDFSGMDDDEASDEAIIKVYRLLKDTDQVIVKKDGNRAELKDIENGTEYVIDFGDGEVEKVDDDSDMEDDSDIEELNEAYPIYDDNNEVVSELPDEVNIDGLGDEEEGGPMNTGLDDEEVDPDDMGPEDIDPSLGVPDDEVVSPEEDGEPVEELGQNTMTDEFMAENKNNKARKTIMKENKNKVLFEVDLGYTDNYQSKDPIEGLSADEPAKNKNDWDAGVPKGTKKPWAGKGSSAPFDTKAQSKLDEEEVIDDVDTEDADLEEGAKSVSTQSMRKETKSSIPAPRAKHAPKVTKNASVEGKYNKTLEENYTKLKESYDKLVKRNKALETALPKFQQTVNEVMLLNTNLANACKLMMENTTTRAERVDIVNRFDKIKSESDSKALYESINKELSTVKTQVPVLEEQVLTSNGSQKLNESKVYENPAIGEIRNMMSRMDKKNFI